MLRHEFRHFVTLELLARALRILAHSAKEMGILAIIRRSPEQQNDLDSHAATQTARLLAELGPSSDLVRLVERVSRTNLPWVVIPGVAIIAWERRDPAGWEKVSEWLAAQGVAIVRI